MYELDFDRWKLVHLEMVDHKSEIVSNLNFNYLWILLNLFCKKNTQKTVVIVSHPSSLIPIIFFRLSHCVEFSESKSGTLSMPCPEEVDPNKPISSAKS